jgi:type II secretory pathway pseudopilin PulG
MMPQQYQTPSMHKTQQGFNLIEVLLAIMFFSLAFSGILLGTTSMINTASNGIKINEDNAVIGSMFTGVSATSAYIEASASQLIALGIPAQSRADNPTGDIATKQAVIIPDNTASTTDNRRFFFDRWVYSELNTPDVKTVQVNFYPTATATTPTKSIIKKLDCREECFAMGVNGSLYLPSFGQPCTGWSSGVNVPQARTMVLTGAGGTQNFQTDFRTNGTSPALITGNQLSLFDAIAGADPTTPTDKGHQVDNGITAEYWIEATPSIAYNLILGLRKMTDDQTYTISVNPGSAIDCNVLIRPRNCQRQIMTIPTNLINVNNNEAFSIKFGNIMPYTTGNYRGFHIRILSTGGTPASNPAVIHYIKKELANN